MSNQYTVDSLQVLEGLDPVKVRPNMYTDTKNPNHILMEAVDNGIDEVLAGYATALTVTLHKDGSVSCQDNGRGIPVDVHPEHGLSGVELILTKLHAGAKFSKKAYKFSGGLHGVGISVTNALSSSLQVTIKREGKIYVIGFADGFLKDPLLETGSCKLRDTGTGIHFKPNDSYFDTVDFDVKALTKLLKAKAVLCPGLQMHFIDEKNDRKTMWCFEEGISAYARSVLLDTEYMPMSFKNFAMENEDMSLDWLVCWVASGHLLAESYANMIPTPQGGVHVNGVKSGIFQAVKDFAESRQLLPKGVALKAEDIWERAQYLVSIKVLEPQFHGQTKEKLVNQNLAYKISSIVNDQFALWLNHHVDEAEALVAFFVEQAQKRMRLNQKTKRKKWVAGPTLPGRLTDCISDRIEDSELFLVEGDSAGGSARQARDKKNQAILPLRGKILNTWELGEEKIMTSQEIHDLCIAMGVDVGSSDLSGLRYGKICILTDADSDGNHIKALLCALFLKHFPHLVEAGHVYVAMPPLYRIDYGQKWCYVADDVQKEAKIAQLQSQYPKMQIGIQRFKGLGEMNPPQLRETTMAKDARTLLQLSVEDGMADAETMMDHLMSKKRAQDRRAMLYQEGRLAVVD